MTSPTQATRCPADVQMPTWRYALYAFSLAVTAFVVIATLSAAGVLYHMLSFRLFLLLIPANFVALATGFYASLRIWEEYQCVRAWRKAQHSTSGVI